MLLARIKTDDTSGQQDETTQGGGLDDPVPANRTHHRPTTGMPLWICLGGLAPAAAPTTSTLAVYGKAARVLIAEAPAALGA